MSVLLIVFDGTNIVNMYSKLINRKVYFYENANFNILMGLFFLIF